MQKKVRVTESSRFICLEGLDEVGNYNTVSTIDLDYCGWEHCYPDFQFGPYVRKLYVIHIVLEGSGVYETRYGHFHLQKGDSFIIYPGEETTYKADHDTPWHYTWVGFHGIRSDELTDKMGFTREHPVIKLKQIDKMKKSIEQMLAARQLNIINEMRRMSLLLYLFSLMIEDNEKYNETAERDYSSDVYVAAVVDYMMIHYQEKIKINELAEKIGIGRSYLTNSFKKKMEMSPQEYLIQLRLERASVLLRNSNEPVQEIAVECGYEDSVAFSKAFKQKYEMSPKNYRSAKVELIHADEKNQDNSKIDFPL